jgi:hypothetical protein
MIADVFRALDEGDHAPLRDFLSQHGVDVEQVRQLPQWNVDSPRDVLPTALDAIAKQPFGVALLLLYLLVECEQTWEVSYHYEPIWQALRNGRALWRSHADGLDRSEVAMADGVGMLLAIVDAEIQVENAMTSGRLGGFADAAEKVVEEARRALMLVPVVRPFSRELADEMTNRADAAEAYYQACAAAGVGLRQFFGAPGSTLDDAIAALAKAEASNVVPDNRKGELRAHRFALISLQQSAGAQWLHVDEGKVVYIYPFAVRAARASIVAGRAAVEAASWSLAGVTPAAVHPSFVADDVWDGSDLFGRRYDGTQIDLPTIEVRDQSNRLLTTLDARVMLSVIGNHYVRMEGELRDANPQDVFAAMFRGAREHGTALVSVAGVPQVWARPADLARDIAAAVGESLGLPVSQRHGMFQVMVVVNAASLSTGPVGPRTEVRTAEELVSAVGTQVLTSPVTNCIGSLAEWVRYPVPSRTNILGSLSMRDDIIVRTVNTTVLVGLGSPSFHMGTRVTVAEFVASVEGLFAGWSDELRMHFEWVQETLDAIEPTESAGSYDILGAISSLKWAKKGLEEFVADTRSAMALIESPVLVASPVVSAVKSGLLDAADFRGRAAELDRQVDGVLGSRLTARIEDALHRLNLQLTAEADARRIRQRRWVDIAGGAIAAIGISGIGQIIQAGYDVRASGALTITGIVLVLSIVVGLLAARANRATRAEIASQRAERRAERDRRKRAKQAAVTVPGPRVPAREGAAARR